MTRSIVPFASLVALLGCRVEATLVSDPGNQNGVGGAAIVLALDKAAYRPGDIVSVEITNNGTRVYGYNLCGRGYERLVNGAWVALPPELRLCTIQFGLPSGATRSGDTDIPLDAPAGTYRMLVRFMGEQVGERRS